MNHDLFASETVVGRESIGPCAFVLRGFTLPHVDLLLPGLAAIEQRAPFRHLLTPGGLTMPVVSTNCGHLGWTSDRRGYRYTETDPATGHPWPEMPPVFRELARDAAAAAGFDAFASRCLPAQPLSSRRPSFLAPGQG